MKKIISAIIIIFAITVITLNILSAMGKSLFGFRMLKVVSGSMEPYLAINDLIIIKEEDSYNIGDIVTYRESGNYITHRIIKIDGDIVTTKGDANNARDSSIKKQDIDGKLIYKIGFLNFFMYMLSEPLFWVLSLLIGITVILLIPDKTEKTEKKEKVEKTEKIEKEEKIYKEEKTEKGKRFNGKMTKGKNVKGKHFK